MSLCRHTGYVTHPLSIRSAFSNQVITSRRDASQFLKNPQPSANCHFIYKLEKWTGESIKEIRFSGIPTNPGNGTVWPNTGSNMEWEGAIGTTSQQPRRPWCFPIFPPVGKPGSSIQNAYSYENCISRSWCRRATTFKRLLKNSDRISNLAGQDRQCSAFSSLRRCSNQKLPSSHHPPWFK